MTIYWICPLVEHPFPNWWQPLIVSVLQTTQDPLRATWATTSGNQANRWAVGAADVTSTQLTAIQQTPQIFTVAPTEMTKQAVLTTELTTFFSANQISVPSGTWTDVLDTLIKSLNPAYSASAFTAKVATEV
jgi:hypothetical protein